MNSSLFRRLGNLRHYLCFVLLTVCAYAAENTQTPQTPSSIKSDLPASTAVGTEYTVTLTAVAKDSKGKDQTVTKFEETAKISNSDTAAKPNPIPDVTFKAGVATFQVQFMTAGVNTLTVTTSPSSVKGSFATTTTVATASATTSAAVAGCASCFATIGAGTVIKGKYPDYNVSSNIIEATHVGISTPSYSLGLGYKLSFHDFFQTYKKLGCTPDDLVTPSEDKKAFCYPYKTFISLKFTPDASQTFNGYTFGLSHALHKYLDLMVGMAYSAHNEISPGFQQAAISVVKAQQAAGNPYYSQFNLAALQANSTQTAFDGFPTQLISANGTTGSLIYSGNITVSHYRPGLFLGISLPVNLKTFVGGSK